MTDDLKGDRPEWARYRRPTPEGEASTPESPPREPPATVDAEGSDRAGASVEPASDVPPVPSLAEQATAAPIPAPAPGTIDVPLGGASAEVAGPMSAVAAEFARSAWDPGPPLAPELEARIRRDLARGHWIVRLTWVAAFASLVLGLVAVRQAALLVAIDRRLVTTEEVQAAGNSFDIARSVLIAAVILGVILAVRWLRDGLPVLAELQRRGVIDGPAARSARSRDRLPLLWRASGVPADRAGWADLRVGAGRAMALATAAAIVLATVVGLVAAIWLGAARDADTSRMLRVVSGIDGALWLIASILVGVSLDAILWREAVAARALGVFIPLIDAPARTISRLIPPILVFAAGIFIASARPDPWFVPCPQATLDCDGMLVPVDHDGGGSNATIWIVYAIHHAEGAPKGTMVVAVGGPGSSGLDGSLATLDSLDEDLVRSYDILFFDQRGVGASEGRECPAAGLAYADASPGVDAARTFAEACVRESTVDPSTLARYSTHQAAEDLESIRDRIGVKQYVMYGESYGTEVAQAYAVAHPDRVSALILDGAVDRTRSANAFWADAAEGFAKVLSDTLAACTADAACHSDVADPARTYDRLLSQYDGADDIAFADRDGVVRNHPFDAVAFESAVDSLLYDPTGRMLIQRAVAAAAHDDPVPATRLAEAAASGDQQTGSAFAYHAVTCADYRVSPTSDPHDIAAVEQAGAAAGVDDLRTAEVYTSQFPCLFWPYQPADGSRPPPLTTTPFPVFVLGATDDPITPVDQARAIASRLSDGYLIVTNGGPHVTFGRQDACVDGPIVTYLVEGRRPASRSITCDGVVAEPYIPLTSATLAGYRDALDAMTSTESELYADPDYRLWDGSDEVRIGCRHGGFVAVSAATVQDNIRFAACAFVAGLPLTGIGSRVFAGGVTSWSVTMPDGALDYVADEGSQHVSGTWQGAAVDIRR